METKEKGVGLFDFLNDLTYDKKDILDDSNKSKYVPFVVNKFLTASIDTLKFASDMNFHWNLPVEMQYKYLLHSIRKKKRYLKWIKKAEPSNTIEVLKEYYGWGDREARMHLNLVSDDDIKAMEVLLNRSSTKKK